MSVVGGDHAERVNLRKMEETGAMARDSLYIYYLSAATVGIWIVNSI